jgi:hypothetical protein
MLKIIIQKKNKEIRGLILPDINITIKAAMIKTVAPIKIIENRKKLHKLNSTN